MARRIARLRKERGLTQAQLADKCGVDRVTIARWELGTAEPQRHLKQLHEALNVTRQYLLVGYEENQASAQNIVQAVLQALKTVQIPEHLKDKPVREAARGIRELEIRKRLITKIETLPEADLKVLEDMTDRLLASLKKDKPRKSRSA